MEHAAQLWNDILFTSRGILELGKCSFHLLHFNFKPDGTPQPILNLPEEYKIQIRHPITADTIPIPAKQINHAHKMLGHYKAPGNTRQKQQYQVLSAKAKDLSILLATVPTSRQGAFLLYHSIFVSVMRYVLPQSFFPLKRLHHLEHKSMPSIFAKCGYTRTTAQALLYAPGEYGGGGFIPLASWPGP